jgi:hypothetical protein
MNLQHTNAERRLRNGISLRSNRRNGISLPRSHDRLERLQLLHALIALPAMAQSVLSPSLVVTNKIRRGTVLPTSVDSRLDQHEIFEIDRSNLVLQMRTLRRVIKEGAEELDMVAIERVFVKSASQSLTRTARKLDLVAEDLVGLLRLVERARAPKAPERPEPKRNPRNRPKPPN